MHNSPLLATLLVVVNGRSKKSPRTALSGRAPETGRCGHRRQFIADPVTPTTEAAQADGCGAVCHQSGEQCMESAQRGRVGRTLLPSCVAHDMKPLSICAGDADKSRDTLSYTTACHGADTYLLGVDFVTPSQGSTAPASSSTRDQNRHGLANRPCLSFLWILTP